MSIQFNRQDVQQTWTTLKNGGGANAQGAGPNPLGKILSDQRITREEYQELKREFEAVHPGEDFGRWLADALDGKLDQHLSQKMLAGLQALEQQGSAVSAVSFAFNDQQDGYRAPVALRLDNPEWLAAAKAADTNDNGRIEAGELAGLYGRLSPDLMHKLQQEGALLTYDSEDKSLVFYPAPEAPTLHGRYKDLKLELDLSLQDVDGISDLSRNDLKGEASGNLHFDWRGPLVNGIKQAMQDKTGGWVELDARYASAQQEYGPGYVIQARSGWLATRPIVIHADPQGQLYLDSPGFGEWARLKMGAYGIEKYALPQLKAMGLDLAMEKKDSRIYLRPKKLELNDLPLSAQGQGSGQLNLDLAGKARFSVASDGMRAHFEHVAVQGSSDVHAAQAQADRDAAGQAAPDQLKTQLQAGMNYAYKSGDLDTQVVMNGTDATLNLDRGEMDKLGYLPSELKDLAGAGLQAQMHLQGAYRTQNGRTHEGRLQGQLDLRQEQGAEKTDAFARFELQAHEHSQDLAVSLSAVDIHHQKPKQDLHVRAVSGRTQASLKTPAAKAKPATPALKVNLHEVTGQAELGDDAYLAQARTILGSSQPGALQFEATLKELGVSDAQLAALSHGSASQLKDLLSTKSFFDKLKQALVQVKAESVELTPDAQGIKVSGQGLQVKGRASGEAQQATASFSGQARDLQGHVKPEDREVELHLEQTQGKFDFDRNDAQGKVQTRIQIEAEKLHATAAQGTQVTAEKGHAQGSVQAQSQQGEKVGIEANFDGVEGGVDPHGLNIDAAQAKGRVQYQSQEGSTVDSHFQAQGFHLRQQSDGQWQLTVPDLDTRSQLAVQMQELREILQALPSTSLETLRKAKDPAEVQSFLEAAGLPADKANKTVKLLWTPELHPLIDQSGFMQALRAGQTLQIDVQSRGDLKMSQAHRQGLQAHTQRDLKADLALKGAADQLLATGKVESAGQFDYAQGQVNATAPELSLEAHGKRLNGSEFGRISARVQDLEGQLGPKTALKTGHVASDLSLHTHLDEQKIEQIQRILSDFRDDLLDRLKALGLNREQFEQILQAFGKNQLEALLKAAKPEALADISADLGLSPEQIEQTLSLFNDEPFQKLVSDLFLYSEMLNDAETQIQVHSEVQGSKWTYQDQALMLNLHQLSSQWQVQTQNEQGQGELKAELSEKDMTYHRRPGAQGLDWQAAKITAEGSLASRDQPSHARQKRLETSATLTGRGGQISREGEVVTTHFDPMSLDAKLKQHDSETGDAEMKGRVEIGQLESERHLDQPGSSKLNLDRIAAETSGRLYDKSAAQTISGQGALKIRRTEVRPEDLRLKGVDARAEGETERQLDEHHKGLANAHAHLSTEELTSEHEAGVSMAQADFDGHADSTLLKDGKLNTRLRVEAKEGQIQGLQADQGKVSLQQVRSHMEVGTQTPMVEGKVGGELQVDGFSSQDEVAKAQGFKLDQINGKLYIDTDRFRGILANNADALSILETISKNWSSRQGQHDVPNLFLNDQFILDIEDGKWQGDASDGNALSNGQTLSASMHLPELKTYLGTGRIDLKLQNLSLAEGKRPEVKLSGTASLQPKQPEFDQSVQALVERSLKGAGVGLKPEVHFVNGEFRVKVDKWFADGLVSVDFEGGDIKVSVDRAKLLHFISARGLATSFTESKLNNYLLDIDRKDTTLNLSLSEFSERLLHRDNLQIQSVQTRSDNRIHLNFAYTDTQDYNQGYRQRQQEKLDQRLFHNPSTGAVRSSGQIDDVVGELEPDRLALIFQRASTQQLRKILASVGNDYDNLVRAALSADGNPKSYPVENRAIMAAYLAKNSGFFESVDGQERGLIRNLMHSLSAQERARFNGVLTADEQRRIQKYL